MKNDIYCWKCGGINIKYSFLFPDTHKLFGNYLEQCSISDSEDYIRVSLKYMSENRWLSDDENVSDEFLEFQSLMMATGNYLLGNKRALFHGAAFIWRNLAWIFTAPSGTGKTTQYRHWHKNLRKEVQVINGDKPVLEAKEDGSIWVHASPWMGKERLGTKGLSAKLGGIILLEQGDHNFIRRLEPYEAVIPLFIEFISSHEDISQVKNQADMLNRILDVTPVWKLTNLDDSGSALMTRRTIIHYLEDDNA